MKINLYLVRHGETLFNIQGKMQGWADSPLTENGINGAIQLGKNLKDFKFDALFTSDAKRAMDTGAYIIKENVHEIPAFTETGIREWGFGGLEGTESHKEIVSLARQKAAEKGDEQLYYLESFGEAAIDLDPEKRAESYKDMTSRTTAGFQAIIKNAVENGWKDILIVSHGLTIVTVIKEITGKPIPVVPNLKMIRITYCDGNITVSDEDLNSIGEWK